MKKHLLVFVCICCSTLCVLSQADTISYSLNARLHPGLGGQAPFLSTVNQWDRHSFSANSLSTWGSIQKMATKPFDYGFGAEIVANVSPTESRLFPGELYVEGKVGPFLAVLGMKREIVGNQDPILSSGGLIGSQNSRPIPGLTLETDGWVDVPMTYGYLEFKGGMSNGWFSDNTVTTNTLFHYKWLHARLGGSFPLTINYALHHRAQWGGSSPTRGSAIVSMDNFFRIFLARNGSANQLPGDDQNSLGNHTISQNCGFTLKLTSMTIDAYWQNISEDKPVLFFNKAYNKRDGLWGVSLRQPKFRPLHALAIEFLSTTDQTGPWHDRDGVIYGGADGYYNNGFYPNGWSFYGLTMGNPWITSPKYNTDGNVDFQNNCVRLWYISGMGQMKQFNYRFTAAHSRNWGLVHPMPTTPKRQFSAQLEVSHPLPFLRNTEVSLGLSGDRGTKYGNNLALLMGIRFTDLLILEK